MTEKRRLELNLDLAKFAVFDHYKSNHGIGYTKLANRLLDIADLNELKILSTFDLPKNEREIELQLPERTSDDIPNVINITARNDIVIASTPKVKTGLMKKGYSESEITEISRYKNGDIFARDFKEYGIELPKNSTITINGIVREGETSLLRNREFSEPLRLVIKE